MFLFLVNLTAFECVDFMSEWAPCRLSLKSCEGNLTRLGLVTFLLRESELHALS